MPTKVVATADIWAVRTFDSQCDVVARCSGPVDCGARVETGVTAVHRLDDQPTAARHCTGVDQHTRVSLKKQ